MSAAFMRSGRRGWLLGMTFALAAVAGGVFAGDPLSSLTPRGPVQSSDQLPILPSGGARLESTTAGAILGYVRNYPAGIYCDGFHDDTAALQAAISAGASFDLPPGVCLVSATLTASTRASHGQTIRGAGATASDGGGAGKTTLRPSAAVSTAFTIDGSPFGGYLQGFSIESLSLDMALMPAGARGFSQLRAYDVHYGKVRVLNDQGKTSWLFGPGAYTTSLDNVQGALVYCLGDGADNPTTITLVNPDIGGLNVEQCANVTTIGGAVQPAYTAANTIIYLPPGASPKGFGPNSTGMYLALGSTISTAQFFTSIGTDWEALNEPPRICQMANWPYGTYSDGVHGCLPLVLGLRIAQDTLNIDFTSATFAGMYVFDAGGSGTNLTLTGYQSGGGKGNYHEGAETFDASIFLNNSQALTGYSDDRQSVTLLIDASDGAAYFSGGVSVKELISLGQISGSSLFIKPMTSGINFAAIGEFGCYAAKTSSASSCFMGSGSKFIGLQDPAGTVASFSMDANTGRITAGSGLCPGAGSDAHPTLIGGTCIVSGSGSPSNDSGLDGWFYMRGDCVHGTSSCLWHKEAGLWAAIF